MLGAERERLRAQLEVEGRQRGGDLQPALYASLRQGCGLRLPQF